MLLLRDEFGKGESEAIVLAQEIMADYVLIDEKPAIRKLSMLNIPRIGTMGIILVAKEKGIIKEVKPYLDRLIKSGFRIDENLYAQALAMAGES